MAGITFCPGLPRKGMRRFLIAVCTAIAIAFAAVEAGCDHAHIQDIRHSDIYNVHAHAKNYTCVNDPSEC
jgi:hypothetical protein